jgi:type I restriction enzyme S subunit
MTITGSDLLWNTCKLGDFLTLKRGYDLPKRRRSGGIIPVVSSSGVSDYHSVAMANGPGVVTGRYGTIGEVFYIDCPFWPLNTALYVSDFKGNDPRFVSYLLRTLDFLAYSDKGAVPGINRNHLHEALITVPVSVDEQRAIASILGALDNKIDLNRKISATLEAIARALFKSWFVDFDPVRAKAEDREPGLPAEIASLFPNSFDYEGKPEGWERVVLREAADILSGGTPTKSSADFWNGPIPWISPKVMMNIHVFDSTDRVMSEAIGNGTRLAASGSVLLMVRGMGLHHGVRISQARRDVTFNQDVKALVPKRLSGTHLLFGMLDAAPYLFSKVQASGHGTGTLPTDIIDSISFVTPANADLCAKLIFPLDMLNDRIATSSAESATLSIIRDTLLPKLISGELRVGEAERVLAASA